MSKIRILHEGGVGAHKAGDVVEKPHAGLVYMAENAVKNAADGKLLCEFVDKVKGVVEDAVADLEALRAEAKELGVKGNIAAMKPETLQAKVSEAKQSAQQADA